MRRMEHHVLDAEGITLKYDLASTDIEQLQNCLTNYSCLMPEEVITSPVSNGLET